MPAANSRLRGFIRSFGILSVIVVALFAGGAIGGFAGLAIQTALTGLPLFDAALTPTNPAAPAPQANAAPAAPAVEYPPSPDVQTPAPVKSEAPQSVPAARPTSKRTATLPRPQPLYDYAGNAGDRDGRGAEPGSHLLYDREKQLNDSR